MRAALRRGDRVDLVDDDGLDRTERLSRLRGEQQVERLGRGDQDVGWLPDQPAPFAGPGVASADTDRGDVRKRCAFAFGRVLDSRQRRAQVLLDVDRERAEGGYVEDSGPAVFRRGGGGGEGVDRRQERGERLAGAGRREEQRVLASADRRPGLDLGIGGRVERGLEPGADREGERELRHGVPTVPAATDTASRPDRLPCLRPKDGSKLARREVQCSSRMPAEPRREPWIASLAEATPSDG